MDLMTSVGQRRPLRQDRPAWLHPRTAVVADRRLPACGKALVRFLAPVGQANAIRGPTISQLSWRQVAGLGSDVQSQPVDIDWSDGLCLSASGSDSRAMSLIAAWTAAVAIVTVPPIPRGLRLASAK